MRHDGNAALGQKLDGLGHALATFEFNGTAFGFLDHARGVAKRLRRAFFIGTKGHIDNDQGSLRTPQYGATMHDHQIQRHRQG